MTASAQQPIATPALTSTNTAYTTLESLLLFHNLSTHGTHPSSFSVISNLLVKNPLIRESETFDRGRLSPDALQEFYLYLLHQESTDATVNGLEAKNATIENGDTNGTVGDLVDPASFTRQMSERFFNEYKERMRVLIRAEEERFTRLAEEIREIEAGDWDERLLANAGEVSGGRSNHCTIQPSDVPLLMPVDSNHTKCTGIVTNDVSSEVSTDPAVDPQPAFPPPLPQGTLITLPLAPVAEDFKRQTLPPPTQATVSTEPIQPVQQSPPQSPDSHKSPQSHQSPQQSPQRSPQRSPQQSPLQKQGPAQQQPLQPPHPPSQQHSQHIVNNPPNSIPIQSPQPQLQNTPQHVESHSTYGPQFLPLTDAPYSPIDVNPTSLPLLSHSPPTTTLPQQLHPSTPQQTPHSPTPRAQSPYRVVPDYGHPPHESPIASTPISIPQYQQLSQLIPTKQDHELSPQPQFLPVDQSQSVQPPPLSPSRLQSPTTSPATPIPEQATSPQSPSSPPQTSQLQTEPLRLTPQATSIPPKSPPKNRCPPIKTDVLLLPAPPPERLTQARSTLSLEVQIPKAEISQPARLEQKPFDIEPRTFNRPGSPIQPGPDEISPISTPAASPPPPDFAEFEASTSRKRSFEKRNENEDVKRSPAMGSGREAVDAEEDDHAAKRRKSVAIPVTIPTLTALVAQKPRAMSSSSADRTAAARAASAAKRAAASAMKRGRGGRTSTVNVTTRAPTDGVEQDVKRESDPEVDTLEQDVTMGESLGGREEPVVEKKVAIRRRKKKKSRVGKRRQNGKKGAMQQDEDKDETADDVSTVESEATRNSIAPEGDEEISDMDVDIEGTSTPQGVGLSKRKRYSSTPPQEEAATPIHTASPKLTATPLAPLPPPLIQTKSEVSSSSSSLSNVISQSPSLVSLLLPKPEPIVGQQEQVIATKKFQQLSAPLLHNISAHRFANLFMAPVGERVAPGYSRLVFRPMDLKTIKAAIKNGAAVVNQLTQSSTANANTSTDPPTTPSTPSSSFAPTGQGYSSHPATTLITPPKGIVNSAQLEKELFRMFANAVMYNKSNSEIVKETVEMGKEVERWVGEFRSAERVGGERARGGGVGGGTAAGWRAGPRHSIGSGVVRTESVTSGRGGVRKGKEKTGDVKEDETKRRLGGRPKKEEGEDEAGHEREDDDKMEEDRGDRGEGQEGEVEAEVEGNGGDGGEDTEEEDAESVAETNEVEAEAEDDVDDDGDADGRSITSSSVAGSTVRGGFSGGGRRGRGGRRGVKRGKKRR